jgi:hypothetical protein
MAPERAPSALGRSVRTPAWSPALIPFVLLTLLLPALPPAVAHAPAPLGSSRLAAPSAGAELALTDARLSIAAGVGPVPASTLGCTGPMIRSGLCATLAMSPAIGSGSWLNVTANVSGQPAGRALAAMTYDASDGYVLLFGGVNLSSGTAPVIGDTWTYQDGVWTNITSAQTSSPSARYAAAIAYDAADGYVVLFGGLIYSTQTYLGDTWTFSAGHWKNITSTAGTAPSPRWRANMAYDASDGYVLLYGGTPSTGPASDTWKFKGGSWSSLTSSVTGTPPALFRTSMVYDVADSEVVLFGGCNSAVNAFGSCPGNSTWTYHNLVWTNATPTVSPGDRGYELMAYDPVLSSVVLFGGNGQLALNSGTQGLSMDNDTWLFAGGNWTNISARVSGDPGHIAYGSMVYDQNGSYIVLFGGWNDASSVPMRDSTWTFGPAFDTWGYAAPRGVDVGSSTNLSAVVAPGRTGLNYSYSHLPAGCTSKNTSKLACTPTATGTFSVTVRATNASGANSSSNVTLVVDSALNVSAISVNAEPLGVGIPAKINVTVRGGRGSDRFTWSGLPTGCSAKNASAISCTPTTVGTYATRVTVSDAGEGLVVKNASLTVNSSYALTFKETGLPSKTSWSVVIVGNTWSSKTANLSTNATNGTVAYHITPIAGYTTTYYGNVSVSGKATSVSVTFKEVTYAITFRESNLTKGTNWSVNITNTTYHATTSTIVVNEPNGTFRYAPGAVTGYLTPASGNVTVKAAAVQVNLSYKEAFALNFSESGLPKGQNWSVTIGSENETSNTSVVHFEEGNGTYSYKIGPIAGFTTKNWTGSVTMNGASQQLNVTFTEVTYAVTFTESGLPAGTVWNVTLSNATLGSVARNSSTSTIQIFVGNGSFTYRVKPIAGWTTTWSGTVKVAAVAVPVAVTFRQVTYAAFFNESGLPSGTSWTVTVGGQSANGAGASHSLQLPNGTDYAYSITPLPGYRTAHWNGTFSIAGAGDAIALVFTLSEYGIDFIETGLPTGTNWSVTFGGRLSHSTGATLPFTDPNGSYPYTVTPIPGYEIPRWSGTAPVHGLNLSFLLAFNQTRFTLSFEAAGLAAGTRWSVSIDGASPITTTGAAINLSAPNGTYQYSLTPLSGYIEHPIRGNVTINGTNGTVPLLFDELFAVHFVETGLPAGTHWTVEFNGSALDSTGSTIDFANVAGSYAYSVGGIPGYTTNWTGDVTIELSNLTITIDFVVKTYLLTFSDPDLPGGASWSVTITGPGGAMTLTSTGPGSVSFVVPNGTYRYTVSAGGYRTLSGSVGVNGPPAAVPFALSAISTSGPLGQTVAGVPLYAWIALAAVVAVAAALALLLRRRRTGGAGEPSEAAQPPEEEPGPEYPDDGTPELPNPEAEEGGAEAPEYEYVEPPPQEPIEGSLPSEPPAEAEDASNPPADGDPESSPSGSY